MIDILQPIKNEYIKEIKQIEEWSGLRFANEVIFESECCKWSMCDSTFERRVWMKEKLAFIVEDMKGIKYGGFLYAKIDKWRSNHPITNKHVGIADYDSFTFTFKDNKPMKFVPKDQYKQPNEATHFFLHEDIDWRMFFFGNLDVYVPKKGRKAACENSKGSMYDYQGIEDALCGQSGLNEEKERFPIKRVIVLQFE